MGQAPSARHFQVLAREDDSTSPANQPLPLPSADQPLPLPSSRQLQPSIPSRPPTKSAQLLRRQHARHLASVHYERFPDDSPFHVPRYQVDNPETEWQDDFFFLGLGKKDAWERRELSRVRHHFREALQQSSAKYEYLVYDVTLVGNGKLLAEYAHVSNRDGGSHQEQMWAGDLDPDHECLVFHGTRESNISKIVAQGFRRKGARDPGWYGQGYYLTSNPEYAVHYLSEVKLHKEEDGMKRIPPGGEAIVIAAFVHLGKSFQVTDMSYFGKPLREGFDSHHVFVKAHQFTPVLHRCDAVADEIVFDGTERILPHYIISFRRKPIHLMWLTSDRTASAAALQAKMCKSVSSKGHSVQVYNALEDVMREMQQLSQADSDECDKVVRFAVTGNLTVQFLHQLHCHENAPVIVISTMFDFDQHVGYVRRTGCHANMVTYAVGDLERFVNASRRELLDDGHLICMQESSCSHPIAAAASRLQRL